MVALILGGLRRGVRGSRFSREESAAFNWLGASVPGEIVAASRGTGGLSRLIGATPEWNHLARAAFTLRGVPKA